MTDVAKVGDAVAWNCTPRGGYGFAPWVPAVVTAVKERVQIAVLRQADRAIVKRWVSPDHVCGIGSHPGDLAIVAEIRRALGERSSNPAEHQKGENGE